MYLIIKPRYDSKDFSKILHGERGLEKPLVEIAKNYHSGAASLDILIRNLIIKTITFKEILETRNSFKNLQNREISWQNMRSAGWGWSLPEMVEEMEQICQLNNLIADSQFLKPFTEPILTNVLIWMIAIRSF